MKTWYLSYGVVSLVLVFVSFAISLLVLLNVFLGYSAVLMLLLVFSLLFSFLFLVMFFVFSRIYHRSVESEVKSLAESLESGEVRRVSGPLFERLYKAIESQVDFSRQMQSEVERLRRENYALRDYLILLEKGELQNLSSVEVQEAKNLATKVGRKFSKVVRILLNVLSRWSYYLYENNWNLYYMKSDIAEVNTLFSEIREHIISLSKMFASFSQKVVEFLNLSIQSYHDFEKFLEISRSLETSWEKFYTTSNETVRLNKEMYNEVSEVMSLVKVISEVSEQTLILAMNALIESSKVGEVGKGFGVIADEIRKLSENVTKFSKTISDKLQVIKGKSSAILLSFETMMDEGKVIDSSAREIERISTTSRESFRRIIDSTEVLSSGINDISYKMYASREKIEGYLKKVEFIVNERIRPSERRVISNSEFLDDLRIFLSNEWKVAVGDRNTILLSMVDHVLWFLKFRGYLDGISSIDESVVFDPTKCRLGRWYYSEGLAKYGHFTEIKGIEKPHERLHYLGKEILEVKGKNSEMAQQLFDELIKVSYVIVENLRKASEYLPAEEDSE